MLFSTSFKELSSFFIESLFCLTTATKERQISYTEMYNAIFLAKYIKQGLVLLSYLEGYHILQVPVNHRCADLQGLCWILNKEQKLQLQCTDVGNRNNLHCHWKVQFRRDWNFLPVRGSGRPKNLLCMFPVGWRHQFHRGDFIFSWTSKWEKQIVKKKLLTKVTGNSFHHIL